jgi:hypothetical protein
MSKITTMIMFDSVETVSVVAGSLVILTMVGLIAYDSWHRKYQKKIY